MNNEIIQNTRLLIDRTQAMIDDASMKLSKMTDKNDIERAKVFIALKKEDLANQIRQLNTFKEMFE